jgi:hypothetical protein
MALPPTLDSVDPVDPVDPVKGSGLLYVICGDCVKQSGFLYGNQSKSDYFT